MTTMTCTEVRKVDWNCQHCGVAFASDAKFDEQGHKSHCCLHADRANRKVVMVDVFSGKTIASGVE